MIVIVIEIKICSKCGLELNVNNFCKDKRHKDGLASSCKKCHKEVCQKYRENNRDKISERNYKEYNANYYEENKEREKERSRNYGKNNKDKVKENNKTYKEKNVSKTSEYNKEYYKKNKDKEKIRNKKYAKENSEYFVVHAQIRAAKKLLLPSTLTLKQWQEIKLHFNNRCCYCGELLPLEQEHFIGVSSGGGYTKENIIPACKSCNISEHNKTFEEWYLKYKHYSREREKFIIKYLNSTKQLALTI